MLIYPFRRKNIQSLCESTECPESASQTPCGSHSAFNISAKNWNSANSKLFVCLFVNWLPHISVLRVFVVLQLHKALCLKPFSHNHQNNTKKEMLPVKKNKNKSLESKHENVKNSRHQFKHTSWKLWDYFEKSTTEKYDYEINKVLLESGSGEHSFILKAHLVEFRLLLFLVWRSSFQWRQRPPLLPMSALLTCHCTFKPNCLS